MDYVYRIFGCGIEHRLFESKYKALPIDQKSLLRRVAWRVWFTLKLRYEVAFRTHPFVADDSYELTRVEIPSLEVYLLVTCLDTFAGQDHQQFPEWLKQQPPSVCSSLEDCLVLFEQWRAECGPRRNLRNLFLALLPSVNEWLSDNVVIQRANKDFDPENVEREPDTLVKRLFQYFYDLRRTEFTHRSRTRHTPVTEHIGASDEWQISLFSGYKFKLGDNRTWTLYHRRGLDEATILRIIIQSVGFQMLGLDAELSKQVVEVQLASHSRLAAVYGFINEVKSNAYILSLWGNFEESEQLHSYLSEAEVPSLQTEWSTALIEQFRYPPERHWRQTITQYRRYVDQLNLAIADFNNSHPVSQTDRVDRLKTIKQFFETQTRVPGYNLVVEMPHRNEALNLGLYIKHPCPPQPFATMPSEDEKA